MFLGQSDLVCRAPGFVAANDVSELRKLAKRLKFSSGEFRCDCPGSDADLPWIGRERSLFSPMAPRNTVVKWHSQGPLTARDHKPSRELPSAGRAHAHGALVTIVSHLHSVGLFRQCKQLDEYHPVPHHQKQSADPNQNRINLSPYIRVKTCGWAQL